jgi:hypothetical protein
VALCQCTNDSRKRHRPDDEDIHVTGTAIFALGKGSENECEINRIPQRRQSFAQNIHEPRGLAEDAREFRINGAIAVRLIADLVAHTSAQQQPGFRQEFQFSMQRACGDPRHSRDLSDVEGLVGAQQEQRQNLSPVRTEEDLCRAVWRQDSDGREWQARIRDRVIAACTLRADGDAHPYG